ncbi:MAG TPA: hypothetical protein VH592_11530 [Gemmataceae bacterium]|jgi:hypothetical protein
MFRPNSSSAGAHFCKPVLETLEDRVVPSQFGDLLQSFQDYVIQPTITQAANSMSAVSADQHEHVGNPSSLAPLVNLLHDAGTLASQAALLQQQSAIFSAAVVQGLQQGLIDSNEAPHLLNLANVYAQLASRAQQNLVEAEGFATLDSIDFFTNQGSGSGDQGSGFDFNSLGNDVVSGIFGGGFFV